jgi:hypothetical protein
MESHALSRVLQVSLYQMSPLLVRFKYVENLLEIRMVVIYNANIICRVRFQVLMAASIKMAVFWVVAPCSLVEVYRRFRGASCLHHQCHSTTTQKVAVVIICRILVISAYKVCYNLYGRKGRTFYRSAEDYTAYTSHIGNYIFIL